jgi:hypothetical protein
MADGSRNGQLRDADPAQDLGGLSRRLAERYNVTTKAVRDKKPLNPKPKP